MRQLGGSRWVRKAALVTIWKGPSSAKSLQYKFVEECLMTITLHKTEYDAAEKDAGSDVGEARLDCAVVQGFCEISKLSIH